jgi:hypothetical protein
MTIAETADRYLQDQTPENFLELRQQVAASPNYSPYASPEQAALALMEKKQYQAAADALMALMPGSYLSPGAHQLLAHIYGLMDQNDDARYEDELVQAVFAGLLRTGDGSPERPYLALHISDEYDLARFLGKTVATQRLVRKDGRSYDVVDCADGARLWFDISAFYTRRP